MNRPTLIVVADDWGLSPEVNAELLDRGEVVMARLDALPPTSQVGEQAFDNDEADDCFFGTGVSFRCQ